MQIRFHCPNCDLPMRISRWETLESFVCPACQQVIPSYVDEKARQNLELDHCLLCDCRQLFSQKAFNRNFGLGIVTTAIILSVIILFSGIKNSGIYSVSLLVAIGLSDLVLYNFLPPMAVCYRCDAEFRGFKKNSRFKIYNHLKAAHVKKQETYPGAEEAAHD